jgi:hypothetical protein
METASQMGCRFLFCHPSTSLDGEWLWLLYCTVAMSPDGADGALALVLLWGS